VAFAWSDKGQGEFCPTPTTWLNQNRWEDDPLACSHHCRATGQQPWTGTSDGPRRRQAVLEAPPPAAARLSAAARLFAVLDGVPGGATSYDCGRVGTYPGRRGARG
jgi:hypothetical protein